MIEVFSLADLNRLTRSRPMGWPRFTVADLMRERRRAQRRFGMRSWRREVEQGLYYTASDTIAYVGGTVWTWQSSGGTFALTCTSLGAGSTRQGVKSSTTIVAPPNGGTNAVPPDFFSAQLTCQHTTAPTAGGEDGVYFSFSPSATAGTSNPAGLSGTDAAGPNIDALPQLMFAGSLIVSNNIGTGAQIMTPFAFRNNDPTNSPYMSPVIYNNASTAFDSTALHTILTVVPYFRQRAA